MQGEITEFLPVLMRRKRNNVLWWTIASREIC